MRKRVAASVAVTALVTTLLSGCEFITPQQTARSYTPSDGVNGQVGDVQIRNVFLVADDEDDAELIGALTNTSDARKTVTLQWSGKSGAQSERVVVPADGLLTLRPSTSTAQIGNPASDAEQQVTLDGISAVPGALFRVGFADGGAQPVTLQLPVLTNALPDYRTLTPPPTGTPPPATAEPTANPTPLPTDSLPSGDQTLPSEPAPAP